MKIPHSKPAMKDPNDCSHTFCPGVKLPVPKQATHKISHLISADIKTYKTISRMAKMTTIKIIVPCEELWDGLTGAEAE